MSSEHPAALDLTFHPVTPERWPDLERLFGERGACAGCWCMWWRLKRSQWDAQRGEGNRQALKGLVEAGETPGILGYAGSEPVAWCSVAPREQFPSLERSRILKRVDQQPVWSIVCFFVARPFRRQGLTVRLLEAAVEYVRRQGGGIVEGYPTLPSKSSADAWLYMGLPSAFQKAGFVEVGRPSANRYIVRCSL